MRVCTDRPDGGQSAVGVLGVSEEHLRSMRQIRMVEQVMAESMGSEVREGILSESNDITRPDATMESFLFHPLSLNYTPTGDIVARDTIVTSRLPNAGIGVEAIPGRSSMATQLPPGLDVHQTVEAWAKGRRMSILRRNHLVACPATSRMFVIDYVCEDEEENFLVTVYYGVRRGGRILHEVACYMQEIEQICRKHMNFFPVCVALCVYGVDPNDPKVYGKRVNAGEAGGCAPATGRC